MIRIWLNNMNDPCTQSGEGRHSVSACVGVCARMHWGTPVPIFARSMSNTS